MLLRLWYFISIDQWLVEVDLKLEKINFNRTNAGTNSREITVIFTISNQRKKQKKKKKAPEKKQ